MSAVVFLCDLSGSMATPTENGQTRIERLREAVKTTLADLPHAQVVCFNDRAWITKDLDGEEPDSSTAMHLGLEKVQKMFPGLTVVFSDGEPNDADETMRVARGTSGVIQTIYLGHDDNKRAIAFMEKLAKCGGGISLVADMRKKVDLVGVLRQTLALPAPSSAK